MNKIETMPSYIYEFDIPKDVTERALEYAKQQDYSLGKYRPNYCSDRMNLHEDAELKEGIDLIYDSIKRCVEVEKYDVREFKITTSRININEPGQHHPAHDHPNCLLTCIWYLNDCDCDTIFFRKNEWHDNWLHLSPMGRSGGSQDGPNMTRWTQWYSESGEQLVDGYSPFIFHRQKTIAGKLVVFPPNMLHLVTENKSKHNRYSLSLNTFPTKFGHRQHEVDFDI